MAGWSSSAMLGMCMTAIRFRPTNSVSSNGRPGALMMVRKTGGSSTLSVVNGIKDVLPDIRRLIPAGVDVKPIFDQSIFVKAAAPTAVLMGGAWPPVLTSDDDPAIPRQLCGSHADHLGLDPALDHRGRAHHVLRRADAEYYDPRRLRPGSRHSGRQRNRRHREHRAGSKDAAKEKS